MALLDWIVIGVFCLALIGIVVWVVSQKNNNSADYFLGGKDATWIAIEALFSPPTSVLNTSLVWLVQEHLPVWLWLTGRFRDG